MRTRTTVVRRAAAPPAVSYRAAELPSGRLMPIEVRIGRRLLRTIPAESSEGKRLIEGGRVEIVVMRAAGAARKVGRDH
jgi:hypothetical protein